MERLTYNAEQEQNHGHEGADTAGNSAPEDTPGRCNAGVLRLLGDMPRRVEPDQDAGSSKIRETPVPSRRGTRAVVSCHEGVVSGPEADGPLRRDGQPDHVQHEIEQDEEGRRVEERLEEACWEALLVGDSEGESCVTYVAGGSRGLQQPALLPSWPIGRPGT